MLAIAISFDHELVAWSLTVKNKDEAEKALADHGGPVHRILLVKDDLVIDDYNV